MLSDNTTYGTDDASYSTTVLTDRAVSFITASEANDTQPFFFYDGRTDLAQTLSQLVLNIDLAPTILDYAHIDVSTTIDGHSFKPVVEGTTTTWRTDFLTESWLDVDNADPYTSVHTGTHVYMLFSSGAEELYNLDSDPYQLTNLTGVSDYADELESLRSRERALVGCVGAEQCQ